ncbi:hypothetical protein HY488_02395 [Candidatus Woesearchaeota archaeon]|nr:hypothetical protein [Candidatus Woesearchaeota archaeon]
MAGSAKQKIVKKEEEHCLLIRFWNSLSEQNDELVVYTYTSLESSIDYIQGSVHCC